MIAKSDMSLPSQLTLQRANASISQRGLACEGVSTRAMQGEGCAVTKLPRGLVQGMVRGKVFTVDKREKIVRGIWESPEQREKDVD